MMMMMMKGEEEELKGMKVDESIGNEVSEEWLFGHCRSGKTLCTEILYA